MAPPFRLLLYIFLLLLIHGSRSAPPLRKICPQNLQSSIANTGIVCKCSVEDKLGIHLKCTGSGTGTQQERSADLTAFSRALQQITTPLEGKSPVTNLKLDNLGLYELPANAFGRMPITSLEITDSSMSKVHPFSLSGQSETLKSLNFSGNILKEVPKLGGGKFRIPALTTMDLSRNLIKQIPFLSLRFAPQLETLRLASNGICSMLPTALHEVKSGLKTLDLSGNCLNSVPAPVLRKMTNLVDVDLSKNHIRDLPPLQFLNMLSLERINLDDNRIIGSLRPATTFVNVPRLKSLSLRGNQLSKLDPGSFKTLEQLEVLQMGGNKIANVPKDAFVNMKRLREIHLDNNILESVNEHSFADLPHLQILDLHSNVISNLADGAFKNLPLMKMLLLQNNTLETIGPQTLTGIPTVDKINLHANKLAQIDASAFRSAMQLSTLDLSQNEITSLPAKLFADHTKLDWLDLSNNGITTFDTSSFPAKITNLMILDNPINCNKEIMGFVDYLVKNGIRATSPQSKVMCAAPPEKAGTPLRELMLDSLNKTMSTGLSAVSNFKSLIPSAITNGLLGSLSGSSLPLGSLFGGGLKRFLPGIDAIPNEFRNIPLPMGSGAGGGPEQFSKLTEPIANLITSDPNAPGAGQQTSSQVQKLLSGLPDLVKALPPPPSAQFPSAAHNVGGGLIPSNLIEQFLAGNPVPGLDPALMNKIVRAHLRSGAKSLIKQSVSAVDNAPGTPGLGQPNVKTDTNSEAVQSVARGNKALPDISKLPPIAEMDPLLVKEILSGKPVPGLTRPQTKMLRTHYSKEFLKLQHQVAKSSDTEKPIKGSLVSLLQKAAKGEVSIPGVNLTNLPPEVVRDLIAGKMPDLAKYPEFLQTLADNPSLTTFFENPSKDHAELIYHGEEGKSRLSVKNGPAAGEYDINTIRKSQPGTSLEVESGDKAGAARDMTWITGIVATVACLLTVGLVAAVIYQRWRRQKRRIAAAAASDMDRLFFARNGGDPGSRARYNNETSPGMTSYQSAVGDGETSSVVSAARYLNVNRPGSAASTRRSSSDGVTTYNYSVNPTLVSNYPQSINYGAPPDFSRSVSPNFYTPQPTLNSIPPPDYGGTGDTLPRGSHPSREAFAGLRRHSMDRLDEDDIYVPRLSAARDSAPGADRASFAGGSELGRHRSSRTSRTRWVYSSSEELITPGNGDDGDRYTPPRNNRNNVFF